MITMNDDIIKRKVALNTIEKMYKACEGNASDYHDLLVAALMNLIPAQPGWISCSERLPEYGVAVLTYDGSCYSVEKRIPTVRDDNGEPISGKWWVSDDYDESNSEYYPNLRDGACIAWMPLPEAWEGEQE